MKSKASLEKNPRSPASPTNGRPIMQLLALLGRRGALRVVWELNLASHGFRSLERAAETNPANLNARLKELREARLVELVDGQYRLSAWGKSLVENFLPLLGWSEAWAADKDRKPK